MKEATGELSGTVITVVAIAAVLTLFTTLLLPTIKNSITSKLHCAEAYGCQCDGGKCNCYYDNGTDSDAPVVCNDPNYE